MPETGLLLSSFKTCPVTEIFFVSLSFLQEVIETKRKIIINSLFDMCLNITANGLGLCEEAELEAQMFSLAQMFIRIPNVQFSTEPAFLQNPC